VLIVVLVMHFVFIVMLLGGLLFLVMLWLGGDFILFFVIGTAHETFRSHLYQMSFNQNWLNLFDFGNLLEDFVNLSVLMFFQYF
jgi:hypothetical protein